MAKQIREALTLTVNPRVPFDKSNSTFSRMMTFYGNRAL
jgi:hypothetical protein